MLSFLSQDVLDEIWDLIESVSDGFPTYTLKLFPGDLSKDNHSPGPVIRELVPSLVLMDDLRL